MKKHRQHHVWQRYLKSWANKNILFCLRDGNIFRANTINIAQDRDFYKLPNLTKEEIALARFLVGAKAHPSAKALHDQFLAKITAPITIFERLRMLLTTTAAVDAELDHYKTNALEEFHAGIESSFTPLLDRICAGDISFYDNDNDCITFVHFICVQYMRTKAIRERTLKLNKEAKLQDLTPIWNLLTYMFAVNIGCSLYLERKRRRLVLVRNDTSVAFITGDQPATNLLADGQVGPEKLSIYYPISPTLALILSEEDKEPLYSMETLTAEHVTKLNARIMQVSHSQVFGHSEASLLALKNNARPTA
jgi:hypothetical protein